MGLAPLRYYRLWFAIISSDIHIQMPRFFVVVIAREVISHVRLEDFCLLPVGHTVPLTADNLSFHATQFLAKFLETTGHHNTVTANLNGVVPVANIVSCRVGLFRTCKNQEIIKQTYRLDKVYWRCICVVHKQCIYIFICRFTYIHPHIFSYQLWI